VRETAQAPAKRQPPVPDRKTRLASESLVRTRGRARDPCRSQARREDAAGAHAGGSGGSPRQQGHRHPMPPRPARQRGHHSPSRGPTGVRRSSAGDAGEVQAAPSPRAPHHRNRSQPRVRRQARPRSPRNGDGGSGLAAPQTPRGHHPPDGRWARVPCPFSRSSTVATRRGRRERTGGARGPLGTSESRRCAGATSSSSIMSSTGGAS